MWHRNDRMALAQSRRPSFERPAHAVPWCKPDATAGKAQCKAALQRELGLPEDAGVPLLGFIGRLDFQKVHCIIFTLWNAYR